MTYPNTAGIYEPINPPNPIGAFSDAYQQSLNIQKQREQAKYYPEMAQYEAQIKGAEAQFAAPSREAEVFSKLAQAALHQEQANYYGMTAQSEAALAYAQAEESGIFANHPYFKGGADVAMLGFLNSLASQWDQQNAAQMPGMPGASGMPNVSGNTGSNQTALPPLPGGASGMGNATPNPFRQIQETIITQKGRLPEEQAALTTQAQAGTEYDFQRNNELKNQYGNAYNLNKNLMTLREAYNAMPSGEKGGLSKYTNPFNFFAKTNSDKQKADAAMNQIIADSAKMVQSVGHINDSNLQLAAATKPSTEMNQKAFKEWMDIVQGGAIRQEEAYDFYQAAKHMGLNAQESDFLFSQYMSQRPATNPNGANWEYVGSYYDYLTPEGIQAAKNGQEYYPQFIDPSKDQSDLLRILPDDMADKIATRIIKYNDLIGSLNRAQGGKK